jgi:hypothetical protein
MIQYRLGRSITTIIPFHRTQTEKPIITNKILVIFAVIATIKVIILLAWR